MHKHLVVSISGHGFGHVAQTAPILNALHQQYPKLRITVRSTVAAEHLGSRIRAPFTHLQSAGDIGMVMSSALIVDVEKSRAAYRAFNADWDTRVADEAYLLKSLHADMVFSNVGFLPLAGAQQLGIPNAALCSLNWADIYRHYCDDSSTQPLVLSAAEGAGRTVDKIITARMHAGYANADAFLRATPGMAMSDLPNLIPVAPIASVGTNRRIELNHHLKLSQEEKLVLVSMGGIHSRLPIENWPRIDGVRYLVQANWQAKHPDAIVLESLPINFGDLLASSDALLCKPGYGSFVEAAIARVPVLYIGRPDWPESPVLINWLQQNGLCHEVLLDDLNQGKMAEILAKIWNSSKPYAVVPTGAAQVARWIAERLV